jgi:uncharacterized repeat protein (TIGR03847 family)
MTDGRRLNLGVVQQLEAESFGEPGQRTFRLRATTNSGGVDLWLEKEQIVALGAAVERILERVPENQGVSPRPVKAPAQISGEVAAHAGALSIAFDTIQNAFALEASELREATLDVESMLLLATRAQLTGVEEQVGEILAGGRPRCPMCGAPLSPGVAHFCPPSNGHARVGE